MESREGPRAWRESAWFGSRARQNPHPAAENPQLPAEIAPFGACAGQNPPSAAENPQPAAEIASFGACAGQNPHSAAENPQPAAEIPSLRARACIIRAPLPKIPSLPRKSPRSEPVPAESALRCRKSPAVRGYRLVQGAQQHGPQPTAENPQLSAEIAPFGAHNSRIRAPPTRIPSLPRISPHSESPGLAESANSQSRPGRG